MNFKNYFFLLTFFFLFATLNAQKYKNTDKVNVNKEWKESTFASTKSFSDNISESSDFTFLSKIFENEIIKNAIESEEMITIFAPSDIAFTSLPETTRDSILDNSHFDRLATIIKYHVVPGRIDSHSIKKAIEKNGGIVYFATLAGEKLGAKEENGHIVLFDSEKNIAVITATDFYHKNGFFHIVSGIVFPK